MRAVLLKSFLACLLIITWTQSRADVGAVIDDYKKAKVEGKTTYYADIDNDTLLLTRSDRFYTSGVRIGQRYTLRDAAQSTTFGWRIGQELYTPSDILLLPTQIGPNDHPYVGWLYGGFFKETRRADGTHVNYGFDLGCLGPCSGSGWTQTTFHRILNQPIPQGWSQQFHNEVGAVLYADMAPVRWTPRPWVDITPSIHGRFGNIYTDGGADMTLRMGRLNLLPDQPTFHSFLRLGGTAVAYNASLQGGYFTKDNSHVVQPKRFVGESEIGLTWLSGAYGVRASVVRRENEIRDLRNASGAQNFVRLQFVYTP